MTSIRAIKAVLAVAFGAVVIFGVCSRASADWNGRDRRTPSLDRRADYRQSAFDRDRDRNGDRDRDRRDREPVRSTRFQLYRNPTPVIVQPPVQYRYPQVLFGSPAYVQPPVRYAPTPVIVAPRWCEGTGWSITFSIGF